MLETNGRTHSPAAAPGALTRPLPRRNGGRTTAAFGRDRVPRYHSIGIGAGPANLSLAALYEAMAPEQIALFEGSPGPSWHNGTLHSGVRMQTSWIKDLVSLVDPKHRLSFLNYLVSTGKVYAFLSAQYVALPRLEYVQYLAWASEQIDRIHYGSAIDRIAFDDGFAVYSHGKLLARSEHLILGVGTRPRTPAAFSGFDPSQVVPAHTLGEHVERISADADARVAVVGGGQTGAECVLELLRCGMRDIYWFGRRPWFAPLDDSPSANDFYRPAYAGYFPTLPVEVRRRLLEQQVLTSDGISSDTLRTIFQLNYEATLAGRRSPVTMLPGRDVVRAAAHGDRIWLACREAVGEQTYDANFVVLATGREPALVPFDDGLRELIDFDENGTPIVEDDFSLRWRGPRSHRIFAQNLAKYSHGLADKNLSLLAPRSATILNSLFGREVYNVRDEFVATRWSDGRDALSDRARELEGSGRWEPVRQLGPANA